MTEARPHIAPEGKIWVCMTCFARHKDRNQIEKWSGQDCYFEAVLCDEEQPAPGFYAVSGPTRD